jgi:hypothetical protein
MLHKGTLDGWGILKEFVTCGPEFQTSSFRFALRWHPNLMRRPDSLKLREHYGQMMQHLVAVGHLSHNGIGDYWLSSQGRHALIEHRTAERWRRRTLLLGVLALIVTIIQLCME